MLYAPVEFSELSSNNKIGKIVYLLLLLLLPRFGSCRYLCTSKYYDNNCLVAVLRDKKMFLVFLKYEN